MHHAGPTADLLAFDETRAAIGPPVLFVHGHPFDRSMWDPQMRRLASLDRRAIAADLRGYGASALPPGEAATGDRPAATTLDVFAEDLWRLLDHLDVDRAVLVGLSMGGQIVMDMCRQATGRVAGLVLAATFPQAETTEGIERRERMAARLLDEGMDAYADEVLPSMVGARALAETPAIGQHVHRMMRGTDPAAAAAALRGRARRPDYAETLAALPVPAAVIVGDADAFTTRRDAERMRDLLANGTLHWLPDVGHMPNLEATATFDTALDGVLERAGDG